MIGLLAVVLMSACSAVQEPAPGPTVIASPAPGGAQRLVVAPPSGGPAGDAGLGGPLGVDSRGCVTLAGRPLAAPAGSYLTEDGLAVEITGHGRVRIGQEIAGRGSVIEDGSIPDDWRGCASEDFSVLAQD